MADKDVTSVKKAQQDKPRVYAHKVRFTLGTGSTSQVQHSESYYLARFLEDGQVELTLLDYQDQPTHIKMVVSRQELDEDYTYIPDYFQKKKSPEEVKEAKHVAAGDYHLKKKEYYSAEYEYDQALNINPKSVRGNYGKGKALLERGEVEEAERVFERLSQLKELYGKKYKHTFNELGIDLRKMGKYDQAIRNYQRAIYMDPEDEVLYYNIAHVYYKKGQPERAAQYLRKALSLKPDFAEAKEFMENLKAGRPAVAQD